MEKKLSMARNVDFNCTWGVANLVSEISGSLACIRRKMKKKTGIELGVVEVLNVITVLNVIKS